MKNSQNNLNSDKEYYQKAFDISVSLVNHIQGADLAKDMLKHFLLKGVQRIHKWIEDELKNIHSIENKKNDI